MLLAAAESPDKIKLTFPEEDARHLIARVDSGRLVMAQTARMGEAGAMFTRVMGDHAALGTPTPLENKIAAAGAAVREGEVDPDTNEYSVAWDIPTIRTVRSSLLRAVMDENIMDGKNALDTPADDPASRLYDELQEAESELRRSYEQSQGEPCPLPDIDAIVGPKIYG